MACRDRRRLSSNRMKPARAESRGPRDCRGVTQEQDEARPG